MQTFRIVYCLSWVLLVAALEESIDYNSYEDEYEEYLKEYAKDDVWANNTRGNDTIPLLRNMDSEFYTQIAVGRPGQLVHVVFDTKLRYSWVISAQCDPFHVSGCRSHNNYNHKKSSTYQRDGKDFKEEKSELIGFYSLDNVTIGQSSLRGFSFIEMTQVPSSFALNKADGVFALGPKFSFFHNLYRSGQITKPIYSIFLNRDKQSNRGGSLMLGYYSERYIRKIRVNNTNVPEEIHYLKIEDGDYWKFSMNRVMVISNPTTNVTLCENGCKAVVNVISGLIVGPPNDIKEINYQIDARLLVNNTWVVNCDTINKLPRIDFVIDGKIYSLVGRNYILKQTTDHATVCVSAFTPDPNANGTWTLGAAFLSQYYSIYDIEKQTIGLVRTPT